MGPPRTCGIPWESVGVLQGGFTVVPRLRHRVGTREEIKILLHQQRHSSAGVHEFTPAEPEVESNFSAFSKAPEEAASGQLRSNAAARTEGQQNDVAMEEMVKTAR